jgi:2-polyprenyl-3-methyl-5-hydroxy-6-metoxy-1,4-benzoquinol methylase|tara:strand:+ start:575 stop:1246 length:672 start_codon:yes stop_codon:yes gene_type:complete
MKKKNKSSNAQLRFKKKYGLETFGLMSNKRWQEDPRGLLFSMARYKFVSKMFEGKKKVLEVGCGDGWFSRIVAQSVKSLIVSDNDPIFIDELKKKNKPSWNIKAILYDAIKGPTVKKFDAIYLLDVFEHISKSKENIFINNIKKSLNIYGSVIVGVPSLEFQKYVKNPDPTHVNCKTSDELKKTLEKHFENVFLFSMNDEIVHTGFKKMANYFFALCTNKKNN